MLIAQCLRTNWLGVACSMLILFSGASLFSQEKSSAWEKYQQRVEVVTQMPGLAAFWDFVQRQDGIDGGGRFVALTADSQTPQFPLEPRNISRDFWQDGPEATMADFPLMGRGPFGQAIQFSTPKALNELPVLMIPRAEMHDTPLDVKGPGKSVSMVVWLIYQQGGHAIAGLWHEGTDTKKSKPPKPAVIERGHRQYCIFAGLGAKNGASAAHVSENGLASFGDIYARHLSVTPDRMQQVKLKASAKELDAGWLTVGMVFDNEEKTVTSYLNGQAKEYWAENPEKDRFYRHLARAWRQAKLAQTPGQQPGEDPNFPTDQYYSPPEETPLAEEVLSETGDKRVLLRSYPYTKVQMTQVRTTSGKFKDSNNFQLKAVKANPYWFGHDLYSAPSPEEGSPFTIGRVIHSNRHPTLSAWIGGVAVYAEALTSEQMKTLSNLGKKSDPEAIGILHLKAIQEK
ncbi:Hypothetical protein PBC10988_10910 [Planctomycetales bacterium 10988]|nr:Hypothetical protein PBC10988_10910 [Planctomycetales bacterium 10988]